MKPQPVVRSRTSSLEREQFGDSNPRVVFLPFSETLLDSAKGNTPCWQQPTQSSRSDSANYPVFDRAGDDGTGLTLVPFDQELMSLRILKRGRWEPLSS
jgi:hypothetical protein